MKLQLGDWLPRVRLRDSNHEQAQRSAGYETEEQKAAASLTNQTKTKRNQQEKAANPAKEREKPVEYIFYTINR